MKAYGQPFDNDLLRLAKILQADGAMLRLHEWMQEEESRQELEAQAMENSVADSQTYVPPLSAAEIKAASLNPYGFLGLEESVFINAVITAVPYQKRTRANLFEQKAVNDTQHLFSETDLPHYKFAKWVRSDITRLARNRPELVTMGKQAEAGRPLSLAAIARNDDIVSPRLLQVITQWLETRQL